MAFDNFRFDSSDIDYIFGNRNAVYFRAPVGQTTTQDRQREQE